MKKYVTGILGILILIGLSGCGTKECQYVHEPKFQAGSEIIRSPKLNTITTREIGSSLYEKTNQLSHNTYDAFLSESIPRIYTSASGEFKKGKGYIGILSLDKNTKWKCVCTIGEDTRNPYKVCLFDSNNDNKFDKIGSIINTLYTDLDKPVPYRLERTKPSYNENSFKYIALYQGKVANKIKISFREYINNMARPAFTQNIEYELKSDGTALVGFKGLRINVLKATNLDITYKVIKDYN